MAKIKAKTPFTFTLQWHLTARCQQDCRHCYMKDEPTYESELKNELDKEICFRIIDDFFESFSPYCQRLRINFTGGDPLLKEGIFELIDYASKKNIWVGILGNPNLITPTVVERLKKSGLKSYQVSIDGLEKTHDWLRGRKGLFQETLKNLRLLKKGGIRTVVMFTLSKANKKDLVPLIRFLATQPVDIFDFARLVPCGKGKEMKDQMLSARDYRDLLMEVFYCYLDLKDQTPVFFGRKDSLWNLLYYQLGLLNFIKTNDFVVRDAVVAPGEGVVIVANRRLP